MTVKLPTKKSAAKTETKVEISKKTLPDGSIEEVKKTITKTTIDGKTEIKTKTETTIIPKDDEEEEEVEEEEEENGDVIVEEVDDQQVEQKPVTVIKKAEESSTQIRENGQDNIIKTEERSETTTTSTKKVVFVQNDEEDKNEEEEEEEVEEEEIEEAEPVTVILKKPSEPASPHEPVKDEKETQVEEEEQAKKVEQTEKVKEVVRKQEEEEVIQKTQSNEEEKELPAEATHPEEKEEITEEIEEEEQYEEAEEKEVEVKVEKEPEPEKVAQKEEDEESEYTEEENEPEKVEVSVNQVEETKAPAEETKTPVEEPETSTAKPEAPVEVEIPIQKESDEKQELIVEKQEQLKLIVTEEIKQEKLQAHEPNVPLREPSVPLEKVEDVEIKPIGAGNFVTKSRTETTEIITGTGEKPTGLLTEYNRTENIVTVNRTTKTLDYENSTPQTIPTLTYFTPHIEKFPPPPSPASRPYQAVYPSEPTTSERRHSLLLERLSMERQIPTNEIYQNTQQYNQTVEQQNQWSQEPRVEILTIENVKPSSITNQQWYQQTEKKDVAYNNVAPVAAPVAPSWTQPKQQQPVYQPPSQPAYQHQPQPTYQTQHQPKPVYQPPQPQPVYQTQPQYHPQSVTQSQPQPQYQSSYTENLQQNTSSQQNTYSSQQNYSTYTTPKPTNWAGTLDAPSHLNTQTQYSDSYQNTQQRSSYVPPPWEQDSTYIVDNSQNYYQPPPQNTFTPDINQGWPTPSTGKFSKTTPTAYIPPKPNQSFVGHVSISEPPKQPGRKTYYSEYERRYISVPESTYIPGESKLQAQQSQPQPDPSPAYYYDNNEPAETVEHQWRKELREFTEKAQTQQPDNVKPPWENTMESKTDTQYSKKQETTYTATPTWSQSLRPQSWRERSFESEFVSQEWPKTNTLGRGRPLSSYGKESSSIPERTRGVSVDRYNPNNYQSPVPEPHPPVQTFTHNPPAPHGPGYHNPNVPAYHSQARASAEPR